MSSTAQPPIPAVGDASEQSALESELAVLLVESLNLEIAPYEIVSRPRRCMAKASGSTRSTSSKSRWKSPASTASSCARTTSATSRSSSRCAACDPRRAEPRRLLRALSRWRMALLLLAGVAYAGLSHWMMLYHPTAPWAVVVLLGPLWLTALGLAGSRFGALGAGRGGDGRAGRLRPRACGEAGDPEPSLCLPACRHQCAVVRLVRRLAARRRPVADRPVRRRCTRCRRPCGAIPPR